MINNIDTLNFPSSDRKWKEHDWEKLIKFLIQEKLFTYRELAALALGQLNPSQVGTSIASKKTFQSHYPPRKCWQAVREWHFNQTGKCADCGSRFDLQADHVIPREVLGDAADELPNMTLRCRRCNVIKRPTHLKGGKTYLSTESALMWILFTKHPTTYDEYKKLCRQYGLTMADIRFEEAWAMAHWLKKSRKYKIDPKSKF